MDPVEFAATISISGQFSMCYWFSDDYYNGVSLYYAKCGDLAVRPASYRHCVFYNIASPLEWYNAREYSCRYIGDVTRSDYQRQLIPGRL
jgi:hypothetical protein